MSNQSQGPPSNKSSSLLTGSMSAVSGTMDEDNRLEQRNESFIFPLLSEIAHTVRIPSFIYILQFLLQCVQSISSNLFIGNNHIWDSISQTPKALRILSYFSNFGVINTMNKNNQNNSDDFITADDFSNCLIQYIILVIYIILEIIITFFVFFWYRKKRTFLNWSLYVVEVFYSILNQLIFVPACSLAGYASWQIDCHKSSSSIVFLFISLITAILIYGILLFHNKIMSISVFIPRSFLNCWDSKVISYQVLFLGISAFLAPCTNPFPEWFVYVSIAACILGSASLFYYCHYLPMIHHFVNSLLQGFAVLSIVSSIMAVVANFVDMKDFIFIIVPIAAFIIAVIVFHFVNNIRLKGILKKLTFPEEIKTEKEKRDYFDSLNIKSDNQAIRYVRLGIANISPICTDFSLLKYVVETRPNLHVLFAILQITSMFPCQTQFFSYLSVIVHKSSEILNVYQNFLLYQVRKVQVIRQSSVSKEAQAESKILFKMSEETISLVRGFWGEIGHLKGTVSTASLRYIRNASNKTSSAYLDAIDQFPKSQEIADNYVRFLIEAVGDYKESVRYSKNLMLIEQNRKVITDSAFRSFANTFPQYLTERILDTHGMYIIKQDIGNQAEASVNASTRNQSSVTSQMTSNNDEFDDIAAHIFKNSKLRLALQDVFDNASMPSLTGLRVLSFVSALLVIIFLIVMIIVSQQSSNTAFEMIEAGIFLGKSVTNLELMGLMSTTRVLEFAQNTSNLNSTLVLLLSIKPEDLLQTPSTFHDQYMALNILCYQVRESMNKMFEIVYNSPEDHYSIIHTLGQWESITSVYPVLFEQSVSLQSLRGAMHLFMNQIEQISAEHPDPTNSTGNFNPVSFFYALNNIYMISYAVGDMYLNASQNGIFQCEDTTQTFDIITYIMCIVFVVVLVVLRLINFIFVMKNCNKWSDLLKSVSKTDIQESSKPIYLKHRHKLPTGTVHSAHDASIETVLLPAVFILTAGVSIFAVFYIDIKTDKFFNDFEEAFDWTYNSQQLFTKIMGLILDMFMDYTQESHHLPAVKNQSLGENLTRNIKMLTQYQSFLDKNIIGKNQEFDKFYYINDNSHVPKDYNYAKFLDCTSISNQFNIMISYFHQMRDKYHGSSTAAFATIEFAGLAFIADKYMSSAVQDFLDYMNKYVTSIKNDHDNDIERICIIIIVIIIVLWAIEAIFINMLYHSFVGFKQLIRALPPLAICQNRKIMDFLLGQSESQKNQDTTEVDAIFNASENALITIDSKLVIQTSNPTFTKMTGIQPDAILGQSISYLFPIPEDQDGTIRIEESAFYSAMNEIRNVQGDAIKTDIKSINTKIRARNDENLRVRVTLIPYYNNIGQFENLVIVVKNTEEIAELKNKLEDEKSKTNKLMQSLVPNGGFSSVKGKKHSVFFKADQATLISIEIVGISECVATMTPKDLLKVLEQIFQLFDDAISRYNSISMMRTENDMVYAVSGLFNSVGDFEKQANDTAGFLLEILQRIEDLNIQTSTDIHLRTAAHTGGPITGFIISPDTPYFEMLTSCIKFTTQMQDKGQTDHAQLTQSVVDHLDKSTFKVENAYSIKSADDKENVYFVTYQENKQPTLQPIQPLAQSPTQSKLNNQVESPAGNQSQPAANQQPMNNGSFVAQENEKDDGKQENLQKDLFAMKTLDSD